MIAADAGATAQPAPARSVRAVVRGRVQGVGFRATTAAQAMSLGLRGWVRNRIDGSVEVLAAGPASALERFVAYLQQGPGTARVTGVALDWDAAATADALPFPFETRKTT